MTGVQTCALPICFPVTIKNGLYDNIHAKRKRIKEGSKEKMRKPNTKGAPTDKAFKEAAKTRKKT